MSSGIFHSDYKPNLSLKSLQGMLVSHMHNSGKNKGIPEELVDEVETAISIVVEKFSNDVLIPMTKRGDIDQNDLFKYYGIYREGLSIRKQIEYPDNRISFDTNEIDNWIRIFELPVADMLKEWAVPILTVIYANLNLYYQTKAMTKRWEAFYTSDKPMDWIDAVLSVKDDKSFDPPLEWIRISAKWSYMMFKRI